MYIKKRLGQTAALLLAGMAVGLAGGAFATDSIVPVNWNVSPLTGGAYRETFESAPTWDRQVATEATNSRVTVATPIRANTWFGEDTTKAMKIPQDTSYTNTLVNDGAGGAVSFATTPVFVDMRIQFTAFEGTPPTDAKLAVFVSTTNKIHVVHHGGTTTNTWPGGDLLSAWHQLTVRLQKDGKCAVLLDDVTVTNNLTPVGSVTTLNSLEFANSGYVDDLYVSHGNPQAYPGTTDPVPVAAAPFAGDDSVADWLAGKLAGGSLTAGATFAGFDQADMDNAYLLNTLGGTASAATAPTYTFGAVSVDVVSDTVVNVNISLTVTGGTGTLTDRQIQLLGKELIDDPWAAIPDQVVTEPTYSSGVITVTFTGINSTNYKFFKAQIVEMP